MFAHVFQLPKYPLVLKQLLAAAFQIAEGTRARESNVQVPAGKKKKKKEEPTYNGAGSSTDTPPLLHMTLIIGNLLQQWQPESITTNSCP